LIFQKDSLAPPLGSRFAPKQAQLPAQPVVTANAIANSDKLKLWPFSPFAYLGNYAIAFGSFHAIANSKF
jgi:hypothetical protein